MLHQVNKFDMLRTLSALLGVLKCLINLIIALPQPYDILNLFHLWRGSQNPATAEEFCLLSVRVCPLLTGQPIMA
jgi:hypothetical protein